MIACITPNPAIDRTLILERLRVGTVHRVSSSIQTAGGKGLNVARAAFAMGADVVSLGPIGGVSGETLAALALDEGIRGAWTWVRNETRMCVIVVSSDGESTVLNEVGPFLSESEWSGFMADVSTTCRSASHVTISGSLPPNQGQQAMISLIKSASIGGAAVWVDTSGEWLEKAISQGVSIKINHEEAAAVLGRRSDESASRDMIDLAADFASEICSKGADTAVVTVGPAGAVMHDRSGTLVGVPPTTKLTNATASGDSFLGCLVASLDDCASREEALAVATACGAYNAGLAQPADLSRDRVMELKTNADVRHYR